MLEKKKTDYIAHGGKCRNSSVCSTVSPRGTDLPIESSEMHSHPDRGQ